MKRELRKSIVVLIFSLFIVISLFAQDMDSSVTEERVAAPTMTYEETETTSGFEVLARKLVGGYMVNLFIDGGWLMWPLLGLGIWGLALCIWKFVSLSYAKINVANFLNEILPLLKEKKYKQAEELANNTKGPIGSMVHAGLQKIDKGVSAFEKSLENTATIEMAFLERQFISMSTCINLAPLVGFFGTILGMIVAFDAIAAAGDIDPTIVAEGIELALITTMAGLAVAIPVQLCYNLLLQMVDNIVLDMQRASDKILEVLMENK